MTVTHNRTIVAKSQIVNCKSCDNLEENDLEELS